MLFSFALSLFCACTLWHERERKCEKQRDGWKSGGKRLWMLVVGWIDGIETSSNFGVNLREYD